MRTHVAGTHARGSPAPIPTPNTIVPALHSLPLPLFRLGNARQSNPCGWAGCTRALGRGGRHPMCKKCPRTLTSAFSLTLSACYHDLSYNLSRSHRCNNSNKNTKQQEKRPHFSLFFVPCAQLFCCRWLMIAKKKRKKKKERTNPPVGVNLMPKRFPRDLPPCPKDLTDAPCWPSAGVFTFLFFYAV